jgi:urea transport system ATP-binding protein
MLKVENLEYAYGEVNVLRDVNLHVETGKIACLMGRNGVGKTTLMKNIIGIYNQNAGKLFFQDADITRTPAHKRVQNGLAYVPQGRQIFPKLSVEENLRTGLGARKDRSKKIPPEIYEYFPVLGEMRKRMGGDLSGGQQQQLAIGRALATDPALIVLDEPTEGIQPNIIQHIGETLALLVKEKGLTVLIVEQYLDFVREFSESFFVMNRGSIVAEGATANLDPDIVHQYLSV